MNNTYQKAEPTVDESYQKILWPYIAANENIHIFNGEPGPASDPAELVKTEYQDYDRTLRLDSPRIVAGEKIRTQVLLSSLPVSRHT